MLNLKQVQKILICISFAYFICGISDLSAQLCVKADCAALGYTKTASNCENHFNLLYCPFDTSKVICGGEVKSAGSGVDMFYYNGKLYYVTQGGIGGKNYSSALSSCENIGYRLPTSSEAYRISGLRSQMSFTVHIDVYGSNGSVGIWTSTTCSNGHSIAYLDGPRCQADTFSVRASICVKEI